MQIEEVLEKTQKEYGKFILQNDGSFLQSFLWGEFQESVGNKVKRYVVKEKESILISATVFKHNLPFKKSYLYIPYGPVVLSGLDVKKSEKALKILIEKLKQRAKKTNSIFLKIEQENSKINLEKFGFKKSEKDIQARETLILDISKSEEEILKGMKQKTRYNIKVAKKHEVNIFEVPQKEVAFNMFYNLLEKTSERNKFNLHPKKYYENMVDMFFGEVFKTKVSEVSGSSKFENLSVIGGSGEEQKKTHSESAALSTEANDEQARQIYRFTEKLYFAEYKGEIIATALIGFFGKRVTYLHGASLSENRKVMAPYLLHWEIIRKAKELGFSEYDFWGIVTKKTKKDQIEKWSGFSRFKMGFGGKVVEYGGAYDLVFGRVWYFIYNVMRKIL